MFDLVRFLKSERPGVPVVCCRLGPTEVPRVTLEAMAIAATSMGADAEFRSAVLRHVRRRT